MKDEPEPPPPPRGTPAMDEAIAQQEVEDRESWELMDAAEQSKKIPARFANRVFVSPEGLHFRVSFGERIDDENVYHTTLVIPHTEALEIGRLLTTMAQRSVDAQVEHLRDIVDALEQLASGPEKPNA